MIDTLCCECVWSIERRTNGGKKGKRIASQVAEKSEEESEEESEAGQDDEVIIFDCIEVE